MTMLHEKFAAHQVLVTALDSLEGAVEKTLALQLIAEWYDRGQQGTVEEQIIYGAHARILGRTVILPKFEPSKKPADRRMFEVIAKAWLTWATGGDPTPLLNARPKPSEYGGAIHMMALEPWAAATKALHERNGEEARRFFRRSVELGSQYDTETNEVVKWAYVASFFHEDTHRGT